MKLLYLNRADVEALGIGMDAIIATLETAFREKGMGRVEMPPKPGVHPQPEAFLHAMPAYIPALRAVGLKWVSGFPDNPKQGLPYIMGLFILNDPDTGQVLAVMDATWLTAMRTGAVTALAAKYLARPEAKTVGILGCGVQGRSNLLALHAVFELQEVRAYDIHPERARAYAQEMGEKTGLRILPVAQPRDAVTGCDIVVTAGPIRKTPHATIKPGWLQPGAFAAPVDFDTYWDRAALAEADKFCTDDTDQLYYYQKLGYFQNIPPVYADLGEIVAGHKPGRERPDERIICCHLGLAIDDVATGKLIYDRARERGLGTWLDL